MRKYRIHYNYSLKNGWLADFYSNKRKQKWNKENSMQIALLYNNRREFSKKNHYVYKISCRNGWIDDICKHMEIRGNITKRMIYSYIFPDNYIYVGLTYDIDVRNAQHMSNIRLTTVGKHRIKTGLIPTLIKHTDYIPIEEAKLKEGNVLNFYKNKGYLILNISRTGGLGGCKIKCSKDKCVRAVSLCRTSKEFRNNYKKEYWAAQRHGWLAEITSNLIREK